MNLKPLLLKNISFKQTIFKNTFWLTVAEIASKTPTFFLNILIIRYLGTENYGKFAFAFAFGSPFAAFTDFGLSILAIKEIAKDKNLVKKYLDNLLTLKLALAFTTAAFIFLISQFLGKSPEVKILIYLVTVFTIITSFWGFFLAIFQAFEKMEYIAITKLFYSFSLCALTLLIIWQKMGLKILVSGYLYSSLITLFITLILVRKRFAKFHFHFNFNFWKKTLKQAWPFGLIVLLGSLFFQINTIQIGLISTNTQVGLYNAAYQFIIILTTLTSLFFASLFPALSKKYSQSKVEFYNIINFFERKVILSSLAICLILILASKKLILLVYGIRYSDSTNILRLLAISIFILLFGAVYSSALRAADRQKQYLWCLSAGVFLNFLVNFPFIHLWGGTGASLANILSSFIITTFVIIKFKKLKTIDIKQR